MLRRSTMRILQVNAASDNVTYLLIDESSKKAMAVDPLNPEGTFALAEKEKLNLTSILTTHHHRDHCGGNEKLVELAKIKKVYGGDDRILGLNEMVKHGDKIELGENVEIQVFHTPCHTTGHVLYYATDKNSKTTKEPGALFCGDTLFIGGCGRFFEGNGEQMNYALNEVIAGLPDETEVYCGHEYTVGNLKFAHAVEPDNNDVKEKLNWALKRRENGETTIPSTVGEEKKYNPFMRVHIDTVQKYCNETSDLNQVMDNLREKKNNFRG